MVLGLLTLAAIPTTIGVAEGISSTKKKENEEEEDPFVTSTTEAQRMRKFQLQCYCDAPSKKAQEINKRPVVLRDGCLWIHTPSRSASTTQSAPSSPFIGFYVPYPDPSRHPPPLGLVSFTPSEPPMLNWIYVHHPTRELRYSNRSGSIEHTVGPWAWDIGPEDSGGNPGEKAGKVDSGGPNKGDNGGGITLSGTEGCLALETDKGWQLFWEDAEGEIPDPLSPQDETPKKRRKLQVSIERIFLEDAEDAGAGVKADDGKESSKDKEDGKGQVSGKVEVHNETGSKEEERRTEASLEVRTQKLTLDEDGGCGGKKKEEKTKYEYRS